VEGGKGSFGVPHHPWHLRKSGGLPLGLNKEVIPATSGLQKRTARRGPSKWVGGRVPEHAVRLEKGKRPLVAEGVDAVKRKRT